MSPREWIILHQPAEEVRNTHGIRMACTHHWLPYLEMNQRVHQVVVDLGKHLVVRPPGKHDKLRSQQGHQEQSGLHCLQVHVRVGLLGFLHLLHKHADDVEQKEEVDLQRYDVMSEQTTQSVPLQDTHFPQFFSTQGGEPTHMGLPAGTLSIDQ